MKIVIYGEMANILFINHGENDKHLGADLSKSVYLYTVL